MTKKLYTPPTVVYTMWASGRFDMLVEFVRNQETKVEIFLNGLIHSHSFDT